jgi:hypothetical protein
MGILRKYTGFISNFKSARPLLFALFVHAAKALLRESSLKLGGVGKITAANAEYFTISAKIYNIRPRILRQSKLNEYIIIDKKVGDDHRSLAKNPMIHALSGQLPFGKLKLDLKQSSFRRVRSSNLKLASWRGELVVQHSTSY